MHLEHTRSYHSLDVESWGHWLGWNPETLSRAYHERVVQEGNLFQSFLFASKVPAQIWLCHFEIDDVVKLLMLPRQRCDQNFTQLGLTTQLVGSAMSRQNLTRSQGNLCPLAGCHLPCPWLWCVELTIHSGQHLGMAAFSKASPWKIVDPFHQVVWLSLVSEVFTVTWLHLSRALSLWTVFFFWQFADQNW